ncbi:MAG: radical SAM protein [Bacteroidales bacterium]|nr:radical SAM protein [Bacteroidales bacterium]
MKQSSSVCGTDSFFFAGSVIFRPCTEGWLAICVETANWLVLHSDLQKIFLEKFITGQTVGDVLNLVNNENDLRELRQLFAAITAREFARTDEPPKKHYVEASKTLNCYITNACNLRCEHCFMRASTKYNNELSLNDWKHILDDFVDNGGESVTFTGGEPMLNIDFPNIVKYAHGKGLKVTVLSNGTLWRECDIINLSPHISEIQISLDGFNENSNAKVRGAGHFDHAVNTIIAFANNGVRTSVSTTFTLDCLDDNTAMYYKQMIENIKSRCKNPVFFKLSKKLLPGRNVQYTDQQNNEYYNKILQIERQIDANSHFSYFMEGHTPNLVLNNCGFGGISIGADGEVYMCNRVSEVDSLGKINKKPLKYYMEQGRQINTATSVDNIIPCKSCYLRYICFGGCRIDDCNFHGKVDGFEGDFIQIKCNEENKKRLERKMIDSYMFFYKF